MKTVLAYHASPDLFDEFSCTEHGVHLGSVESALEAISRKVEDGSGFYLYTVEINTTKFVEEIDHGHDWRSAFKYEPESVNGYVYKNEYEPSSRPSYVTWKPKETLKIVNVVKHAGPLGGDEIPNLVSSVRF